MRMLRTTGTMKYLETRLRTGSGMGSPDSEEGSLLYRPFLLVLGTCGDTSLQSTVKVGVHCKFTWVRLTHSVPMKS